MIEVINPIPQIDRIVLDEGKDFYQLYVSYTPRYGWGIISHGSNWGPNKEDCYDYIEIANLEDWESEDIDKAIATPKTQIRIVFPKKVYFYFEQRDKETDHVVFAKMSFFKDTKELFSWNKECDTQ
jgi:hypothetical protein